MRGFVIRMVAWRRDEGHVQHWTMPGYVTSYDPDARRGEGEVHWLTDLARARIFASEADAVREVERQGVFFPLKLDGRPNRPLAERYVVKIVEVEMSDGDGGMRVREVNRGK